MFTPNRYTQTKIDLLSNIYALTAFYDNFVRTGELKQYEEFKKYCEVDDNCKLNVHIIIIDKKYFINNIDYCDFVIHEELIVIKLYGIKYKAMYCDDPKKPFYMKRK